MGEESPCYSMDPLCFPLTKLTLTYSIKKARKASTPHRDSACPCPRPTRDARHHDAIPVKPHPRSTRAAPASVPVPVEVEDEEVAPRRCTLVVPVRLLASDDPIPM
jgi:hypothetical protein